MGTLLALRIQEQFEDLPPTEQKLATVLLERSDDILTFSATELARLSGVSKATAVRLFRRLGYQDFNDVRAQARQERDRTGPVRNHGFSLEVPSGSATISTFLQAEMVGLAKTLEGLRSDELAAVGERIAFARRVWVAGLGADAGLALNARLMLARARPAVELLPADSELWPLVIASAGPGDLFLVVASRPWPRPIEPLLDFARTARVQVIVLTDPTSVGKVRRFGATALVCHGLPQGGITSQTAFVSMATLLHIAVVEKLGSTASLRGALIDELQEQISGG